MLVHCSAGIHRTGMVAYGLLIGEPHTIGAQEKFMSCLHHRGGVYLQNHSTAAALTDSSGGIRRRGEVNVMARPTDQALSPNRVEESPHRSMKEDWRRRGRLIAEVDVYAVALIRPNAQAVLADGEALLVAPANDDGELVASDGCAGIGETSEYRFNGDPPRGVEREAHPLGLVPQVGHLLGDDPGVPQRTGMTGGWTGSFDKLDAVLASRSST